MGSLFIEIGQCGCQVGMEVNQHLAAIKGSYTQRDKTGVLHTIMLDTQPKIIQPLIENRVKYHYLDPSNLKFFQYGRANNWSYGYLDSTKYNPEIHTKQKLEFKKVFSQKKPHSFVQKYFTQNASIIEFTMENIRRELQKTSTFLGVNVIFSLGGGTGSGLGTRVVEEIKNNFKTRVICHSILPNESGETPLQHYNCALSLASIYQNSHAIFTYENDKMTSLFSKENDQVSLQSINKYIGKTISSVVSINDIADYDRYYFDLIDSCAPIPDLKFLEAYSSYNFVSPGKQTKEGKQSKSPQEWDKAMNSVFYQIQNANNNDLNLGSFGPERKERTFHSEIILRGDEEFEYPKYSKKLKSLLNPMDELGISEIIGKKQGKECLVIANRSRIVRYLTDLIRKGEMKLDVGAYTWNYMVDIQPAFESLHNIVDNYNTLFQIPR